MNKQESRRGVDIESGELRETVAVQAGTDVTDAGGGLVRTWAAVTGKDAVRAQIITVSGTELLLAAQLGGKLTHKVMMRYDADVTRNNRLLWGSRVLNILRVRDVENKTRWMMLECAEDV